MLKFQSKFYLMEKLLTVEFDNDSKVVEIHLNDLGIDTLLKYLQSLKNNSVNDHHNLMSSSWGGKELSDEKQNEDNNVQFINHLKIIYWKE